MPSLTRDQVIAIIGEEGLDDEQLAEIIETGATEAELLEAWTRINQSDDYIGSELRRPLTGRVADVYEILAASRPPAPDEL